MASPPNPQSEAAKLNLDEYFTKSGRYSDQDICNIATLLEPTNPSWAKTPRLCVVLRRVGKLELLDTLIAHKIADFSIPLRKEDIADYPSLLATNILLIQNLVLTNDTTLNKKWHRHLDSNSTMSFQGKRDFSKRNGVHVQEVSRDGKSYAQKTIARRGPSLTRRRGNMSSFTKEVSALRKLNHHHIVALEVSWTELDSAGFCMSPVADCNLSEYFEQTENASGHDLLDRQANIRGFYGCLAAALAYIHGQKVRHKDIKPENILVETDIPRNMVRVLLTDFGTSRDSSDLSRSETEGTQKQGTLKYMAREAAESRPRDSSSDVWSLGCVYLEMVTVIKRKKLDDLRAHMKANRQSPLYYCNQSAVRQWIKKLRKQKPHSDSIPLLWVEDMLEDEPSARCKAVDLRADVLSCHSSSDPRFRFCRSCCDGSDSSQAKRADVAEVEKTH